MQTTIQRFIDGFALCKEFFLKGYCYWFAVILKERFGGEIMYDVIYNHFVCRINERDYDASGDITGEYNLIPWDGYEDVDYLQYERIVMDCIEKRIETLSALEVRKVYDYMLKCGTTCKISAICKEMNMDPEYLKEVIQHLIDSKKLNYCTKIGRDQYIFSVTQRR